MNIGAAGNYTYSYDAYGRLNQINDITYSRLADSNLPGTVTRPNNVNTTWFYETNRDLVTGVSNGMLSTYSYVNDALGRRQSMAKSGSLFNPAETLSYAYNDRSEVTGASSNVNTNYSYFYAFDPIGNRVNANLAGTAVSYTSNMLNQYTAVNSDAPTYDDDGNMLANGAWAYTWNGENRLITAVNGTQRVEFSYDYMGRRIEKKVYSGETLSKHVKFVYDGYKLVEELDGLNENALLRSYTWQPDSVGVDVPLTVTSGSNVYFYHTDANKNVTELTDNTGALAAHYEYSPFGMQTVATGAFVNENPFRFSSEYYDTETWLVYYNYRYYSPSLGRWTKKDPIEEKGGENPYGMVGNNIISNWDQLGLECCGGEPLPQGWKCCGTTERGRPYNPKIDCCCNPNGTLRNKKSIEQSYYMIMFVIKEAYNSKSSIFGDDFNNYHIKGNQCLEQSQALEDMLYQLREFLPHEGGTGAFDYWNYSSIGGVAATEVIFLLPKDGVPLNIRLKDPKFLQSIEGVPIVIRLNGAEYTRHHVLKISSTCSALGDCPFAGKEFIIDPLVKDLGTRYPTVEDFEKKYPLHDETTLQQGRK